MAQWHRVWVLERCSDAKFPYRLRIYRDEQADLVLSLLVRDRWPGANQHIFCLREQRAARRESLTASASARFWPTSTTS